MISGYKVNVSKLIIMGLNITAEVWEQIKRIIPTPWKSMVKYLGLTLIALMDKTALIDLNITPINDV